MAKTVSFHNGSAVSRGHNLRDEKAIKLQKHIDSALSHNNEYLIDIPPREAYSEIFGEALRAYNAKQNRPERRIDDYYTHVLGDKKKHPVYEAIIQVGDKNDTGVDAPAEKAVIKEFIECWNDRNPNLALIGAYLHMDETNGTIHAHLDYIPVATGYRKGLEKQNGLTKALEQQGFSTEKETIREMVVLGDGTEEEVKTVVTAQTRWQESERQALEKCCKSHGIETARKNEKRKHLETPEYKSYKKTLDKMENEYKAGVEFLASQAEKIETGGFRLDLLAAEREEEKKRVKLLKLQKEDMEDNLERLKEEHDVIREANKTAMADGLAAAGGMENYRTLISKAKADREVMNRLARLEALEKYIEKHFPGILESFNKATAMLKPKAKSNNIVR